MSSSGGADVVCWWMPAGGCPLSPGSEGKEMIQFQSHNGCTSAGRDADDVRPVCAPLEVARPFLPAWVEESHSATGNRIISMRLCAFETIARTVGEPEILFRICAAARGRDEMLDFQFPWQQPLRGETVAATIPGSA